MGACETLSASHAHPGNKPTGAPTPATLSTSRRFPRSRSSPAACPRQARSSSPTPCRAPQAPGAPAGPRPRAGTKTRQLRAKHNHRHHPTPTAGGHRARPVRPLDSRGPHGCGGRHEANIRNYRALCVVVRSARPSARSCESGHGVLEAVPVRHGGGRKDRADSIDSSHAAASGLASARMSPSAWSRRSRSVR